MSETHRERPAHVLQAILSNDHQALSEMGKRGNLIKRRKCAIKKAKLTAQARENEMIYLEELRLAKLRQEMLEQLEQTTEANEDICPVD